MKTSRIMFKKTSIYLIAMLVFMLGMGSHPVHANFSAKHACTNSAKAAYRACGHDIKDDFWIQYGNCVNTRRPFQALSCISEAFDTYKEDRELCRDQRVARKEICQLLGDGPYMPKIKPANFLGAEEIAANPNHYFPLTPGLVKVFESGDETITVTVTDQTKEILGIECIVVRDTVEENGELVEDTYDWYAQDVFGNVWYFGELSMNYEDGELTDLDGSWQSGVDGAQPGLIMKASPAEGEVYRQEYLLGEAEDMAQVYSTFDQGESAPAADCSTGCLVIREFLPIEPDVEEFKYYVSGLGFILASKPDLDEREELVEITLP